MPSPVAESAGADLRRRWRRWWPWLAGVAVGVAVLGPALGPGALFNLDLVLTPVVPVPQGVWGLGPELPRRLPFMLPLAWASSVVEGLAVAKVALVALFAVAFAGAARLVQGRGAATVAAAGLVYAGSPFLVTRVATGYLGVALMAAVLPWALPRLARPSASPPHTFLAAALLGLSGVAGGIAAAVLVVAGLVAERERRPATALGLTVAAQVPWLVPGLVVYRQGVDPAAAADFATRADGLGGPLRVLAGHGFWQDAFQVGRGGVGVAVVGGVLLVLAVLGHRDLPSTWRRPAGWVAAVGAVLALASAVPVLDTGYEAFASTPVGAPLREGHRLLPLYLVWLAPAAALGARRLGEGVGGARRVTWLVLPLAAGAWLLLPGLWGAGGQLDPAAIPAEWAEARRQILDEPGPVASLPWAQYYDLNVAGGRRVLAVMPSYLGGDVLVASDPNLDEPARERADPREPAMDLLALRVQAGEAVGEQLARLGVRWVVLQHDIDWQTYDGLRSDPGLRRVVDGPTLELFEVVGWQGAVVTDDGRSLAARAPIAPVAHVDGSGPATWARPGAWGWLRGTTPAAIAEDGQLRLPAGSGPVWYWPTVLVLAADAAFVVGLVVAGARVRAARSRGSTSVPTDVL